MIVVFHISTCLFVQKIHQKLMSDPECFPTLQSIVQHEVRTEVAQVRNSATEALLWLRRGLKFLKEFLSEVNAGERDIQGALSMFEGWLEQHFSHDCSKMILFKSSFLDNAYGKTLRIYHGWVVRGVFAVRFFLINYTSLLWLVCICALY